MERKKTSEILTCDGCKHYVDTTAVWGVCVNPEWLEYVQDGMAEPDVRHDFGCNLWEEKTEG